MAISNQSQLQSDAEVVRLETTPRANTALRVGQLFRNVIDTLFAEQATLTTNVSNLATQYTTLGGQYTTLSNQYTTLAAQYTTLNTAVTNNTTAVTGKEPAITPGLATQYWRGDKTWQTLSTAVLASALPSGFDIPTTNRAVAVGDTIQTAVGLLQKQAGDLAVVTGKLSDITSLIPNRGSLVEAINWLRVNGATGTVKSVNGYLPDQNGAVQVLNNYMTQAGSLVDFMYDFQGRVHPGGVLTLDTFTNLILGSSVELEIAPCPTPQVATAGTGTLAVTNGSYLVVGTGTAFTSGVSGGSVMITPGEILRINGVYVEAQAVIDANTFLLTSPYSGASASGLAYTKIVRDSILLPTTALKTVAGGVTVPMTYVQQGIFIHGRTNQVIITCKQVSGGYRFEYLINPF